MLSFLALATAATAASVVLAQIEETTGGAWPDLLSTYGPFAPFAALLLYLLNLLWKDNKKKEDEIKRLSEAAMERVLPLVLEATRVLADAIDALNKARESHTEQKRLSDQMHSLSETIEDTIEVLKPLRKRP